MFQMPPYPLTRWRHVPTVVPLVDNRRNEAEMSRGFRSRLLSAGVVALALTATACGGTSSSSGGGSNGTQGSGTLSTLTIANAVKVDTLDPEANSVNESIWLDQNLYSRLLQPNPTGTGLLPDLATSWTISNKGLTYTFHLRPNAEFANGMPLTASDVVYSIQRSRAYKGGWGFLLTAVKSITAPDAHTEVDLARNPHFYGVRPKISKVKILIVPNDNTRVLELESKKVDVIENPPGNLVSEINKTP